MHSRKKAFLVFDSSAIIVFAQLGLYDKVLELEKACFSLVIPRAVANELFERGRPETRSALRRILENALEHASSQQRVEDLKNQVLGLDEAEIGVIATCLDILENQDLEVYAVIDERKGRKECIKLGLKVIGSLAIIRLLKESGLITKDEAEEAVEKLPSLGFYVTQELIRQVLRQIRQN